MQKIYGVYFICCIEHYLDIVKEQLDCLNKGLINITDKLIVFITKYNKNECVELDEILSKYDNIVSIKTSDNPFEQFAINNYKKFITEEDYYLYYFHTKGLKKKEDPYLKLYESRRQLLNYYTIEQYNINIKLLNKYDAVGCSLQLYPKKHFSGNFWWSKSSYLQHLNEINGGYLAPEMYILSNDNCKYISLANDTNTVLIDNYNFPNEKTIEENITDKFIIIDEHKKLLFMC